MKYLTNISATKGSAAIVYLLFFTIICAFPAYAVSSATFEAPTVSDNATVFLNWTYVNITSGEDLNRSFVEWGNASGFTNVTMLNESYIRNWYLNMTNLTDGTYNYTIWMQNTTGNWSQSERRFIAIYTAAPYTILSCQNLTIENGSYVLAQNVSSVGTCFTILANNITLDGAGYTINYSQSATGYGVNNSGGYDNLTIKNLNIAQGNGSVTDAYAIYGNGMSNGLIINNNLTTSGLNGHAMLLAASSNSNNVSNNNITTNNLNNYGIFLSSSNSNRLEYNNISTYGQNGYGIFISASSGSNTVSDNTVFTLNTDSYGIYLYLSINQILSGNSLSTTSASAIYLEPTTVSSYYNHTISTTNTEQGKTIYYYFANSSGVIENLYDIGQLMVTNSTNMTIRNITVINRDGITLAMTTASSLSNSNITTSANYGSGIQLHSLSNSNNISNNTITTSGSAAYGIWLWLSRSNNISNNNIITSGINGFGIYTMGASDSNIFSGNSITTEFLGGFLIDSATSNVISGGSIRSNQSYAYYLASASTTNNFTSTNFTAARKIYFADTASYFNYNNDSAKNIWLKTSISAASSINRTLINWTNITMQWNETNSTAGITATYIITGLAPSANYKIYNTSNGIQTNSYNWTTDSSGALSAFTIALNGNTEIKVTAGAPIVTIHTPENNAYFNYVPYINGTASGANLAWIKTNSTPYNTTPDSTTPFNFTNTSAPLPDGNYTINVSANGTDGSVGWATVTFTKDTVAPTFSSNPTTVGSSTSSTATITWTPDGETNYTLRYGGSAQSGGFSSGARNASLSGLSSATTYSYNVTICDRAGNCILSDNYNFGTLSSSNSTSSTDSSSGGATTSSTVKSWAYIASGGTATMAISSSSIYVTQIDVTVNTAISNAKLSVSRFTAKPAGTATAPEGSAYQYLSITPENLPESKISDAEITFKVSTKWMSDNNIDSSKIMLYRYSGGAWNALSTYSAKGSTSEYTNYVADTPGFSYFAIIGKTKSAAVAPLPKKNDTANVTSGSTQGTQNSAGTEDNSTQDAHSMNTTTTDSTGTKSSSIILVVIAILLVASVAAYYFKTKQPTKWKTDFKSGETKPEEKKGALIQLPKPQYKYKPPTKNSQILDLIKESVNAPKKKPQREHSE